MAVIITLLAILPLAQGAPPADAKPYEVINLPDTVSPGTWNVAVNGETNQVYVVHKLQGRLGVLDGRTNQMALAARLPRRASEGAFGIAVNAATGRIYITGDGHSRLIVLDAQTFELVADVSLRHLDVPFSRANPAADAVNNEVYIPTSPIAVVDGGTNQIARTIDVPVAPFDVAGVAVDPAKGALYISVGSSSGNGSTVSVDSADGSVISSLPVGGGALALNSRTNRLYVSGRTPAGAHGVTVIDTVRNTVVAALPGVGDVVSRDSVAVNERTNRIFVTAGADDSVTVINGFSNRVERAIDVDDFPFSIAVNPDTGIAYTANLTHFGDYTVSVIDTAGHYCPDNRLPPCGRGPR